MPKIKGKEIDWEKEFFTDFVVSDDEKQEYRAYPCYLTKFQAECIAEKLGETLSSSHKELVEEIKGMKITKKMFNQCKQTTITLTPYTCLDLINDSLDKVIKLIQSKQ